MILKRHAITIYFNNFTSDMEIMRLLVTFFIIFCYSIKNCLIGNGTRHNPEDFRKDALLANNSVIFIVLIYQKRKKKISNLDFDLSYHSNFRYKQCSCFIVIFLRLLDCLLLGEFRIRIEVVSRRLAIKTMNYEFLIKFFL